MLAVTLGLTYIDFMAVLVIWYGNLPDKVDWFVAPHRDHPGIGWRSRRSFSSPSSRYFLCC